MKTVYFTEGFMAGQNREVGQNILGFVRDTKGYRWHYLIDGFLGTEMKLFWEGTITEYVNQNIKRKAYEHMTAPKIVEVEL